ncbi:hypothetical protein [Halobaculum gomorrense]|uniref:hypothetical protein n=1 Tax=Halobaculum gomorrense TaxID=43928 RepID=UPI0011611611|nr:hypothetical protein [Halobaculum gomorrense]
MKQLAGTACYQSDKDEYGMIEVRTCLDNTADICCLSSGETGTQRIGVTNWRSHLSTIEISIRSLNQDVVLVPDENEGPREYEYTKEVYVPPSLGNDIKEYELEISAKRDSDPSSTKEMIQVSMTIDTEEAAEAARDGPTLYSEINFT